MLSADAMPLRDPMRIAILCETFAPDMGYLTNTLPKYLARAGLDVHVISLGLPPYFRTPDLPPFITAQALAAGHTRSLDGFQLHVVGHGLLGRYPYARGLSRCLSELRPDIVYSIGAIGFLPLQAALALPRQKYKLYTGNHTSAEAFPLARRPHTWLSPALLQTFITRWLPGRLTSLVTERCYCRTAGCAEIASRYFGVQRNKVRVVPLGIDTDFFFPVSSDTLRHEREALRTELGFSRDDIVCINTGRMVPAKELSLLVDAITRLRSEGLPFRGLFIGDGPERAKLATADSCVVLPFVPFNQLANYYRASDVAVWPAGESTSMFDATACGLPLVVSDAIDAHLSGNGRPFRAHDLDALVAVLTVFSDAALRASAGRAGAQQVREQLDCKHAATVRIDDFWQALRENA